MIGRGYLVLPFLLFVSFGSLDKTWASEVALSHGSRIRIGNSRFVFKDPSMKDIEVELAQFDDDDGWGMLGDVDLSRAKGGYGGLLVGLLLLAAAAAGAWFFVQSEQDGEGGGIAADSNLIADGTFQDESPAWSSAVEGAPIRVTGGSGKPLLVRYDGAEEPEITFETERGRLLIRNVCMVFDEYFRPASTTAYSKAI